MNIKTVIYIISLFLSISCNIYAADTYWVHPTDNSSIWSNCKSETDPGSGKYCSLSTMSSNVAAGNIVYLKGGQYSVSATGVIYLHGKSGEAGNVIVISAASGETPILTNTSAFGYGFYMEHSSYIKLSGLIFRDCPYWGSFQYGSSYIEIANCQFISSNYEGKKGRGIFTPAVCTDGTYTCFSTNNWIHDNIFSGRVYPTDECAEGVDALRTGSGFGDGNVKSDHNNWTIEGNLFEYVGHTLLDNYSSYSVIRNNIFHNEPWITGCTTGQSGKEWNYATSSSSVAVGTGEKSFTIETGKSFSSGTAGVRRTSDPTVVMNGTVTSYNSGTGALVLDIAYSQGSGTYSDWTVSHGNYPYYTNSDYNGKFGHRNLQLTDDYGRSGTYNLVEGNRLGHASMNPGNDGGSNLDLGSSKNIVRYNYLYNSMASGLYLKYADSRANPLATSTTEVEYEGVGTKTFTTQASKGFYAGQYLRIRCETDDSKGMWLKTTSYSGTTLSGTVYRLFGTPTGSCSSWTIWGNGSQGGHNNRIYNNTLYHNGYGVNWRLYGSMNMSYNGVGIRQTNNGTIGSTGNIIKNNLLYDNAEGDICSSGLSAGSCSAESWDTVSNNYLNASGDPIFVNPILTSPTSQNLFTTYTGYSASPLPNLSLGSSSGAIDGGTYLTTVHADDIGSGTSLILTDAMYFQAGSAASTTPVGSSLSIVAGDVILVGTTVAEADEATITDINYATNIVTISSGITRTDGEYVWLKKKSDGTQVLYNTAPDYGAYEYNSESGYILTVSKAGSGVGTVTSDVTGIDCGATCTYDYDGTVVTLTATATSPNYFAGWSGTGGCTGTSTCQVTMSAARAVTATFSRYGTFTPGAGGSVTLQ